MKRAIRVYYGIYVLSGILSSILISLCVIISDAYPLSLIKRAMTVYYGNYVLSDIYLSIPIPLYIILSNAYPSFLTIRCVGWQLCSVRYPLINRPASKLIFFSFFCVSIKWVNPELKIMYEQKYWLLYKLNTNLLISLRY